MAMEQHEEIRNALELRAIDLPDSPRIVKLDWDYYEDSSGDEGIEIEVVFDAGTTDDQILQAPIHEIKRRILDSLREHEVTLFPYFTFMREDEYDASSREG